MNFFSTLLVISAIGYSITLAQTDSKQAIQIISPTNNHSFELKLDELNKLLQADDIKDRHVVVVSIAGAFRQGKSFLLNIFVKYLYAQYQRHDVTDWLGETNRSSTLDGFKWRGGRKPETNGIWMWSEIFTHDYANGERVAIILIDTQGIFDSRTSMRECVTIFALSTLLSSVQCFNLMQNIKEDDLQHLELFTEYGRLALEQSHEKPFQQLLFIVRDWPYAFETDFGWHGKRVIDEILATNDQQTNDMVTLRRRIDSSFQDIGAFLMPYPGYSVAQGNNFNGNVQEISEEFRKHVKELAVGLFAPDKLKVKTINGQKVRARDLIQYLEIYMNTFNSDEIPAPQSILMATAEASMQILFADCLNLYIGSMEVAMNKVENYLKMNEIVTLHHTAKTESLAQFDSKPKLGGDTFVSGFRKKIENRIEEKFESFNATNEAKYKNFVARADLHNEKIILDLKAKCEQSVADKIEGAAVLSLADSIANLKQTALNEFNVRKMGDGEITESFRKKLSDDLDHLQFAFVKMSELYHDCLNNYVDVLQKTIASSESYLSQNDLVKLHQATKKAAQLKFSEGTTRFDGKMAFAFQRKVEHDIDGKFPTFEQSNESKRIEFINRANAHNEGISNEIIATFENRVLNGIGGNYLSDDNFYGLFMGSKTTALNEFASRKMGDDQLSNNIRIKLERDMDMMQSRLKQINEANKPPPPPPQQSSKSNDWLDVAIPLAVGIGSFFG